MYFIDPYEENIIDSPLTEYSQIFQSSNSKYEIYNDLDIKIENNIINIENQSNFGLDYFNGLFKKHLVDELTTEQYISVNLFEVSQFIRMLPFKKEIDKSLVFQKYKYFMILILVISAVASSLMKSQYWLLSTLMLTFSIYPRNKKLQIK